MLGQCGSSVFEALRDANTIVDSSRADLQPLFERSTLEDAYDAAQFPLRGGLPLAAADRESRAAALVDARNEARGQLMAYLAKSGEALPLAHTEGVMKVDACKHLRNCIAPFLSSHQCDNEASSTALSDGTEVLHAATCIPAAIRNFNEWLFGSDGAAQAEKTEAAVAMLREAGGVVAEHFFTRRAVIAAAEHERLQQAAHDAFTAESNFWGQREKHIAAAPVAAFISAAQSADVVLSDIIAAAAAQEAEHHRCSQRLKLLRELQEVDVDSIRTQVSDCTEAVRHARQAVDHEVVDAKCAEVNFDVGDTDERHLADARGRLAEAWRKLQSAEETLRASLLRVLDRSDNFPELLDLFQVSVNVHVPSTLQPLWNPELALSDYNECEEMVTPTQPGHAIFKARRGDRLVVVKRHVIDKDNADENIGSFFDEVSILCKLKSPHVVKVEQISIDRTHMFIQMPHYALGTLLQWATAEQTPPIEVARRCLHQVAVGLNHLCQLQVVHCDVKPENIFDDANDWPRIGDFDVGVDVSTRTSIFHTRAVIARTSAHAAGTLGHMAPEVQNGTALLDQDRRLFLRCHPAPSNGPDA